MENKRQTLVYLIFSVFLAIIFEGALRKWVFPAQQQILFFVRDPFVVMVYLYALHFHLKPSTGVIFFATISFTVIITLFSFFQTLETQLPWWVIAYSWRTHFLMLPISLLMGSFLKSVDIKKLFRFTLWLTPLYTVVVYFQSISARDHWINAGRLGFFKPLPSEEGIIRTEGFFTSSIGNTIFAGMLVAILLLIWLKDSWSDCVSKYEKVVFSLLSVIIIILSGQRGTFMLAGLVVFSGFIASLLASKSMLIKFLRAVAIALVLAALLLVYAFPQHMAAIKGRFSGASRDSEFVGQDLIVRTLDDLTNFQPLLSSEKIPWFGRGLGYSSNAAFVYNITAIDVVSESEWGRHIIELGPFWGLVTIGFRVFLFFYLMILSFARVILAKDPAPIIFFSVLSTFLLTGQLTGNGIASGFIWFLTGIMLALIRSDDVASSPDEKS